MTATLERSGALDVKRDGVAPIVDLACVRALETASTETATVSRLRAAPPRGGADLVIAFADL